LATTSGTSATRASPAAVSFGTPIFTALTLAERSTQSTEAIDLSVDAGLRQAKIVLIDFDDADFDQT
jgi:hypothetical protein